MYKTIDELRAVLNEAVAQTSPSSDTYTNEHLSIVLDAQQIIHLLESLLENRDHLIPIAQQSYTHSNGFDKITLIASINPEYKLRLHVWWPTPETSGSIPIELIHDHRWHFRSTVLAGSIRIELFQRAEQGPLKFQYRYHPRDDNRQTYSMYLVGRASLTSGFKARLGKGSTYSLDPGMYHRVICDDKMGSATVFLRWGATKDIADVFSDVQIDHPESISRPSFSVSEMETKLICLLQLLGAG